MHDWRIIARGQPRERNTREEVQRLKERSRSAKALVFREIYDGLWRHDSFYGTYIIENTFEGTQKWRARRNGTLVKDGMVTSMEEAKAAVSDDIKRRKSKNGTTPRPLGSLSPSART